MEASSSMLSLAVPPRTSARGRFLQSLKEDDMKKKSVGIYGLFASVPLLLGAVALGGCGGSVTTRAIGSVAFNQTGGYVLVPRESKDIKERTIGADAFFCQNRSCKAIPVEDLTLSEEEKMKKKKEKKKSKGSFPLEPKYIGVDGGYILIPRETSSSSFNPLLGTSFSISKGSAGADAFYCGNLACQKIPVKP